MPSRPAEADLAPAWSPADAAWSLLRTRTLAEVGEGLETVQLRVWLRQLQPASLTGDLLALDAPVELQETIEHELGPLLARCAGALWLQVCGSWMTAADEPQRVPPGEELSSLEVAWAAIVGDARAQIADDAWDSWLAVLQPISCDGNLLWISAPDHARSWIEARLVPVLSAAASRTLDRALEVRLAAPAASGVGEGRDLLGAHHLQGPGEARRRGLVPAQATMAPVPSALFCARGEADEQLMGRRARYTQHPTQRPGELTPRDVLVAATLHTAALYNDLTVPYPECVAVPTTATELWRALDPTERQDRQPPYDARDGLRASLGRLSAFYARVGVAVRVEVAVEPGRWVAAHEAPEGFGAGGRRPTVRLVLEREVLERLQAWQRGRPRGGRDGGAWSGTPVDGHGLLRLDHLRGIRSASELALYVICDALPAVDGRGRKLARAELRQARGRGGARRTLRLSGRSVGELGDRLGVRHARPGRRAARVFENLLRLRALAPERFGRPAVRITDRGVYEFVLPLKDTAKAVGEQRETLQAVVAQQLRQARRVFGALVAFPEHLQATPHRGPPAH